MNPEAKIIYSKRNGGENVREMERKIDDLSSKLEYLTLNMRNLNATQEVKTHNPFGSPEAVCSYRQYSGYYANRGDKNRTRIQDAVVAVNVGAQK